VREHICLRTCSCPTEFNQQLPVTNGTANSLEPLKSTCKARTRWLGRCCARRGKLCQLDRRPAGRTCTGRGLGLVIDDGKISVTIEEASSGDGLTLAARRAARTVEGWHARTHWNSRRLLLGRHGSRHSVASGVAVQC
jgi:hypothetical protein